MILRGLKAAVLIYEPSRLANKLYAMETALTEEVARCSQPVRWNGCGSEHCIQTVQIHFSRTVLILCDSDRSNCRSIHEPVQSVPLSLIVSDSGGLAFDWIILAPKTKLRWHHLMQDTYKVRIGKDPLRNKSSVEGGEQLVADDGRRSITEDEAEGGLAGVCTGGKGRSMQEWLPDALRTWIDVIGHF